MGAEEYPRISSPRVSVSWTGVSRIEEEDTGIAWMYWPYQVLRVVAVVVWAVAAWSVWRLLAHWGVIG
jgi:hypothetical protein